MAALTCVGFATGTVTTAAQTLASIFTAVPAGATVVDIFVETASVRYRADGTAPTTAVGYPTAAGTAMSVEGDLTKIRIIAQSGTATLQCHFYG